MAEIVGGVAIVLSLVFVGYEIQESGRSQTRAMTQALVSSYADTLSLLTENEDLRCAYSVGIRDFDALNGIDALAFSAYMLSIYRHREDLYFQYLEGSVDPEIWSGFERTNSETIRYPGFLQWWEFRKDWFSDRFRIYIESLMGEPIEVVPFEDARCESVR